MPALPRMWARDVAELAPQAPTDVVAAVGADLVTRLAEPHRSYHCAQHVLELFTALEELASAGEIGPHATAVARLAGWFHDAVYDPSADQGDNERASADLAARSLTDLGLAGAEVARVRELVLATSIHALTSDATSAAFHDADLWILSAPPERYAQYTLQVRREYAAVPDQAFRAGRAAVLQPFLERDSIYATATARHRWEDRARVNVARELTVLRRP